uniref:Beta-defensin n=1 Tax=Castor canadensis TaxID=51338 RepID=A0A8C0X6T4_CASCN
MVGLFKSLSSSNWYVRKCANKTGNCRKACRSGEVPIEPATGMCSKQKQCCILTSQLSSCGGSTKSTAAPPSCHDDQDMVSTSSPGIGEGINPLSSW